MGILADVGTVLFVRYATPDRRFLLVFSYSS
jgi:hypothetical protein